MARWRDDERWGDGGDGAPGGRQDWRRDDWRGGGWRGRGAEPRWGPYRRGDDYGARERGSEDFDRGRGAGPGGRGEGWADRGRGPWRERDYDRGREDSSGEGDYTTYGQSGYADPGRGMHRDLRREQGPEGHRHEALRRGRGPKGWRRADQRIHDEVCERIARSGVNADEVEVRVENGEVILTGTTETRSDKRMIEDLAEDVLGVEDVHNEVRVRREPDPGQSSPGRERAH